MEAAAEHAAAAMAAGPSGRRRSAARTRHRVRALRRHWIPRIEEQLARSELALAQDELDERPSAVAGASRT
ncbi:hypothetical protein ACU686_09250 [Yinghuangia aomiensis]